MKQGIKAEKNFIITVLFTALFSVFALSSVSAAEEAILKNQLTFYGDNTEFFDPYRLRQTLLGQQLESTLEVPTGPRTTFEGGLFLDHPSAEATSTNVLPVLSFRFHDADFLGILGTLQTIHRHGFIEPLEVTILELTRPIEYGFQWIQTGNAFRLDAFLDWQAILSSSQRETFDYGGTLEWPLLSIATLLGQYHGYHVGGVTYPGPVWNNFAAAMGPRFELGGSSTSRDSISVLGLTSKTIGLAGYPGPAAGYGFYTKAVFWLFPSFNVFGIDWVGSDFYSVEGDGNYNSVGYDGVYYQSNRTYEEAGVQFEQEIESNILFDAEFRSHWIDNTWANSVRFLVQVPFDVPVQIPRRGE